MSTKSKFLSLMMASMFLGTIAVNAQIIVNVRPVLPRYEKRVAPSPKHVWVEEDWENRKGTYVFVGSHWVEPPYRRAIWIPGHWQQHPRGWFWKPGHWKKFRK